MTKTLCVWLYFVHIFASIAIARCSAAAALWQTLLEVMTAHMGVPDMGVVHI